MTAKKTRKDPPRDHTDLILEYISKNAQKNMLEAESKSLYEKIRDLADKGDLKWDDDKVVVKVTEHLARVKWKEELRKAQGDKAVEGILNDEKRDTYIRVWVAPVVDGDASDPVPPPARQKYPRLKVVKG